MFKKLFIVYLFIFTSCISFESNSPVQISATPDFVTATLIPTKAGFIPATLTPSPEATVPPTLAMTAPANCKDSAILLRDVTIPDDTKMTAGEKFTKTWEFQNNGTCPWINYTIKFTAGDSMNAPLSAPIPDTAPKGKVQASVELTAPSVDGSYAGYFTLHNQNDQIVPIGLEQTFYVRIIIGNGIIPSTSISGTKIPYIPSGGNNNCAYTQNNGVAQEVISLINQARENAGLSALTINSQLMSAAQNHSADMACNNFLGHTGSDGSWIGDRLIRAGYPLTYNYTEIIAIGTAQNAMNQWQADAPHWDSVLDSSMVEIGAGYAYYSSSDFGGYITVDMGGR